MTGLLGLSGPAASQDTPQPSGTISTEATAVDDAAIETRMEGIIAELDGYDGVTVTVREGIVTFTGEALDGAAIDRLDELAARVDGVVATRNDVVQNTDVATRLDPVLDRTAARLEQALNFLPLLAVAALAGLAVILFGVLIARWEAPWRRLAPNAFIADIYRMVLRLVFVLGGILVALDILNATAILTGLLGAAGIVGLAVGFAVRDTVENFIASIMLSLRQPFRPNDFVDIEGQLGSVIRLTSRATILLDPDGNHLRLPNAVVFKAKIVNYTRNVERRFGFALGVDPASDLTEAKRIGLEVLHGLDFVLADPPPQVWIKEAGDSTITMEFYGWVDQRVTDFMVGRGEALRLVMAAFARAGVGLPEPTYRLKLLGGDAAAAGAAIKVQPDAIEPPPDDTPPTAEEIAPARDIERKVDEERREKRDDDLLSEAAPEE
ncbi:MAG: mechanosensitive ion channel domain-containing protein [Pseudomonadota bacterium]